MNKIRNVSGHKFLVLHMGIWRLSKASQNNVYRIIIEGSLQELNQAIDAEIVFLVEAGIL